jgi:hypothetical protein
VEAIWWNFFLAENEGVQKGRRYRRSLRVDGTVMERVGSMEEGWSKKESEGELSGLLRREHRITTVGVVRLMRLGNRCLNGRAVGNYLFGRSRYTECDRWCRLAGNSLDA